MTTELSPGNVRLNDGLGPLPPKREGQYLTMTICGTNDDPAECGHWSSPAHVQWQIDKAVAAERERWATLLSASRRIAEQHIKRADDCGMLSRALLDALILSCT